MKFKFKHIIATFALAGVMAIGGIAALSARGEVKAASAENDGYWYYRGTETSWNANSDYRTTDGGEPIIIELSAGSEFKIGRNDWSGEFTTASGDAVSLGLSFSSGNNSYVNTAGTYAFSVKSGVLYADFGEYFYSGTDNSWGTTDTTGEHPKLTVNAGVSTWTLTEGEKFKIRNSDWKYGCFGYSILDDGDFYGSFSSDDDGNIVCNVAGSYDVSVSMNNHAWLVRAYPHGVNPDDTAFVYVLDKYGNLLNSDHHAAVTNDAGQTTGYPGSPMETYDGTTHMYKQEFWTGMEYVEFNNNSTYSYKWDISASGQYSRRGKCLILDGSIAYEKWSSETWVQPQTAKFIENFMHFQDFNEDDRSEGTACKGSGGFYALAKAAYEASSFAPYREELCSLDYVVERLQAWASANSKSFTLTNGVGSFSARNVTILNEVTNNQTAIIVVIASVIGMTAVGGYFFLRKRKEN